ncbi:hypothetical protein BDR26DRAFT_1006345 [Obelidium mucronatum]|nr:hypothetical protein BDR26DRAFT_1006345 [Obelidium mucronatum]
MKAVGRGIALAAPTTQSAPRRSGSGSGSGAKDDSASEDDAAATPNATPTAATPTVRESTFFNSALAFFACPFPLCNDALGDALPDPHAVIAHLAAAHSVCVCRREQVMPYLDAYLMKWGHVIQECLDQKSESVNMFNEDTADGKELNYTLDVDDKSDDAFVSTPTTPAQLAALHAVYTDLGIPSYPLLLQNEDENENDDAEKRKSFFFIPDTRANLFSHMSTEHSFHLGSPLNLIQIDEFFTVLEKKMGQGICIYCEGQFPDTIVLRRHMRKKKHFHVNPMNLNYDRFYVVNYADFDGRRWRDMVGEKEEDDDEDEPNVGGHPSGASARNENHDDENNSEEAPRKDHREENTADWDDWHADLEDVGGEGTMCLFEDVMLPDVESAVNHLKEVHGFDLKGIKNEYDLDEYGIIRLINHIRACTAMQSCFGCNSSFETMEEMAAHYETTSHHLTMIPEKTSTFWKDIEHLFPSYEGDPLLTWDCEEDSE